jgi:hypothetical protein
MIRIVHGWIVDTETKTEVQLQKSALRRTNDQVQSDKHTDCTEF